MSTNRADVYRCLAEILAAPLPEWISLPGTAWPLYQAVKQAAPTSQAAQSAALNLAQIPAEPLYKRQTRFDCLFKGPGKPMIWLYESLYCSGKLAGPEMWALSKLYAAFGLEIPGSELPDHASLELAFLGFLVECQEKDPGQAATWRRYEKSFIEQHAGRWLPEVGHTMAASNDPVYGPIGKLLKDWLLEGRARLRRPPKHFLLRIEKDNHCTLCGFCAQVCPNKALSVQENHRDTNLVFFPEACIGCKQCIQVCDQHILQMSRPDADTTAQPFLILQRSPRVVCPGCRQPTVSQAELDFVAAKIGRPRWLEYCLSCRAHLLEVSL